MNISVPEALRSSRARRSLALELLLSLAAGGLGALAAANSRAVIAQQATPAFQPPAWVFPVVWTLLFILMGVSAWLAAGSGAPLEVRRAARRTYLRQLILNILWTVVFFRLRLFYAALAWALVLWAVVIVMIVRFARCCRAASLLQLPYLLWVTYAVLLVRAIAVMN